jgi:tRNA(Arg) A34 adenosine deaminase TadA
MALFQPTTSLAWIVSPEKTFFALEESPRNPHSPHSPATTLILGISRSIPQDSLRILRHRIFVSHPPGPAAESMIRLAAKRFSIQSPVTQNFEGAIEILPSLPSKSLAEQTFEERLTKERGDLGKLFPSLAQSLPGFSGEGRPFERARPILALLFDAEGKLLEWALNHQGTREPGASRIEHAELRLAHRWWERTREPFPPGATLLVSLEPCRMCAGTLATLAHPEGFAVRYLEKEKGPAARHPYFEQKTIRCEAYSGA